MKLELKHEGTVIEKIIVLSKSISYYDACIEPLFPYCDTWEIKESKKVHQSELLEINSLAELMKENQSFWNLELSVYNLSVTTFLSRFL